MELAADTICKGVGIKRRPYLHVVVEVDIHVAPVFAAFAIDALGVSRLATLCPCDDAFGPLIQ
jgi:hypothetical protein